MSLIPKFSAPLVKGIRTTEGILTVVAGGAISLCSMIDPKELTHREAAILLVISGGALTLQRGVIKVAAIMNGLGVAAPIDDSKLDTAVDSVVDQGVKVNKLVEGNESIKSALENLNSFDFSKLEHLPTKEEFEGYLKKLEQVVHPVITVPPVTADPGVISPDPNPPTVETTTVDTPSTVAADPAVTPV